MLIILVELKYRIFNVLLNTFRPSLARRFMWFRIPHMKNKPAICFGHSNALSVAPRSIDFQEKTSAEQLSLATADWSLSLTLNNL